MMTLNAVPIQTPIFTPPTKLPWPAGTSVGDVVDVADEVEVVEVLAVVGIFEVPAVVDVFGGNNEVWSVPEDVTKN
jgi:hypothetical protein